MGRHLAGISIRRAIETLRRQEATLNLCAARARKKVTPEQHARAVEQNMRHIYAREDEDGAAKRAAAPPLSPKATQVLRELLDELKAKAGGDGDSAA